jgi:hypothetical protein
MMDWLKRLFGGSGSSTTSEPASAPEAPSMPSEPPADAGMSDQGTSEPAGDEPS